MWKIPDKKLIFGLFLGLALFGAQFVLLTGRAFAQTRIAADNSIQVGNSAPNSFEVKKTVTFTLSEPTDVFVRYDLGQSQGCCADHMFGDLRILVDGIVFRRGHIPFVNYLDDFDYFFPSQVVMGLEPPVSRSDPTNVGPLLKNYKRVDRQGLGNLGHLAAGVHTFELQLGDAGWNAIFEIYSRLPLRQIAPDATAFGPLKITVAEYKLDAALQEDVLDDFKTELWAWVYMPAKPDHPPYPLLVFLHGFHATCAKEGEFPGTINSYAFDGTCPPSAPIVVPNHAGYGYLAEPLASWGYIVVSINANRGIAALDQTDGPPGYISARGRLVLKHLERLSEWNLFGSQSEIVDLRTGLDVELKGALDFTQVGLLGHSAGGEGVRAAYNFYQFGGDPTNVWPTKIPNKITFRGIFEIAPTDGEEKSLVGAERSRVFSPFGVKWNVLLPMCDTDVFDLVGVKPFDRVMAVGDQTQKSTFTVWGANHNFYNTEWKDFFVKADCVGDGNLRLFPSKIDSTPNEVDPHSGFSSQPLLGRQQRQTALASVMAFFRGNVGRNTNPDFNQTFNPEFGLPRVVTTVTRVDRGYTEGPARVFEDFHHFTGKNTYGFPNDIMGIVMIHDINAIPGHNAEDHDGRQTNRPAGLIFWGKEGGHFQTNWAPPGQGRNISQFQTLEFRVSRQCRPPLQNEIPCDGVLPFLHPLNPPESTNFSVRLMLGGGRLSEPVQLAAYTDLVGPVGTGLLLHPILQTVRIPLADFQEALTSVRGVRFTFDGTPTGAIYMSDIRISGTRR